MGDLLHQFGINGKLLLAQIINFAILVFVLRKFAWGPIVRVLAERRNRIRAAELGAASLVEKNEALEQELAAKRAEAAAEGATMIARAKLRAEEEARGVTAAAQTQAAQIVQKGELQVAKEREGLHAEVRDRVIELTIAATGKLLGEEVSPARAAAAVDDSITALRA